jgi:hypothetical protein
MLITLRQCLQRCFSSHHPQKQSFFAISHQLQWPCTAQISTWWATTPASSRLISFPACKRVARQAHVVSDLPGHVIQI